MKILKWIRELWWANQRRTDLLLLWPICKQKAPNLTLAHEIFMVHASRDPCWVCKYGPDLWEEVVKQCR